MRWWLPVDLATGRPSSWQAIAPSDWSRIAHDLEPDRIAERLEHLDQLELVAFRILELPRVLHQAASSSNAAVCASASSVALGRSRYATRPDATRTTLNAIHNVELNALTYESRAAVAIEPPRTPPTAACVLQRLGE